MNIESFANHPLLLGLILLAAQVPTPGYAQTAEVKDSAPAAARAVGLTFAAVDKEFRFDTGLIRGTLRPGGKSMGLLPVLFGDAQTPLAMSLGLCSHYRLFDAHHRFGPAGWDWASQAERLADGAVEARWAADDTHPFAMQAVYRWSATDTLDVVTRIIPQKDLPQFEVFFASYFNSLDTSLVYARTESGPAFLEATLAEGNWQTFPRDDAAIALYQDGRWQRPPNPVEWRMRPKLARPLALRRDPASGLTALLMAPPEDCFAISTPFSGEGHRSVYLSLFGRDLPAGKTATARARMVLGRKITEAEAVARYEAYLRQLLAEKP